MTVCRPALTMRTGRMFCCRAAPCGRFAAHSRTLLRLCFAKLFASLVWEPDGFAAGASRSFGQPDACGAGASQSGYPDLTVSGIRADLETVIALVERRVGRFVVFNRPQGLRCAAGEK